MKELKVGDGVVLIEDYTVLDLEHHQDHRVIDSVRRQNKRLGKEYDENAVVVNKGQLGIVVDVVKSWSVSYTPADGSEYSSGWTDTHTVGDPDHYRYEVLFRNPDATDSQAKCFSLYLYRENVDIVYRGGDRGVDV